MRKYVLLSIVAAVVIPSMIALFSKVVGTTNPPANITRQQSAGIPSDPIGTISGAVNPELIPDYVAYSLLFRLIADRPESQRGVIRDYVRQTGLGKQRCLNCPEASSSDEDIDALIELANEFHQKISVIDHQSEQIKDASWPNPNPEVIAQLAQLQQQNEAIVAELIAALKIKVLVRR